MSEEDDFPEDQLPIEVADALGSQFLHERDPRLHSSIEVEGVVNYLRANGNRIPNQPPEKISAYLGFLANEGTVNDGILTGNSESAQRQIEANVIKAEDVPESYFDLQRRIAREQGHGDIEITPDMRKQMIEIVQQDQRVQLNSWVEYLSGEEGNEHYPNWFKHYVWTAVTRLGSFDKAKGQFPNRSRGTTASYPELNREALAYVYDVLDTSRIQGEEVNDEKLQKLLKTANFGKLYAHAFLEAAPDSVELRKRTEGSWTKFDQTSDPEVAKRLSESLRGHGTGWCTAGESMAQTQLSVGDFYVYYSRDTEGKDTIPRVAIRMEKGKVAEVRGVERGQEMEPIMVDIATQKFKDLPGGEEYEVKAKDMRRLTELEKRLAANPDAELTRDEVRFLYEMDHEIRGFGYNRDPRVDEIRAKRGERDVVEVARLMPEFIRRQLRSSVTGYQWVDSHLRPDEPIGTDFSDEELTRQAIEASHRLGLGLPAEEFKGIASYEMLEHLFDQKSREWQETGVYDYIAEQFVKGGAEHVLVITPNVQTDMNQIGMLATEFSKRSRSSFSEDAGSFIDPELYEEGAVTPEQLSGASGEGPVRFSLISTEDNDFSGDSQTVPEQLETLRNMQEEYPKLHVRVPSALDAISYWMALVESPRYKFHINPWRTLIRHIDVPVRSKKAAATEGEVVLETAVVSRFARISTSRVENRSANRFAVG